MRFLCIRRTDQTDIQKFLFDLYAVCKTVNHETAQPRRDVSQLLVGVGISLWRAVFIIDPVSQSRYVHKDAVKVLQKLIDDNTFLYGNEKETKDWTAGYYTNNAYFRLSLAYEYLPGLSGGKLAKTVRNFISQQRKSGSPKNLKKSWEDAYTAAREILKSI